MRQGKIVLWEGAQTEQVWWAGVDLHQAKLTWKNARVLIQREDSFTYSVLRPPLGACRTVLDGCIFLIGLCTRLK